VAAGLASLAAFAWTLDGYFVSEDFAMVARFANLPFAEWPRLFVADWSGGIWEEPLPELRPMVALSFIIDSQIWGLHPFGFRLTNLLVHASCAALVGLIAYRAAGLDKTCGVVGAILFALHPVHMYAVAPICGRGDSIASGFFLAGFLAFLHYRENGKARWLAVFALAYTFAAFSKEYGFTLPFLILVADGTWLMRLSAWRQRSTWAPYACSLGIAAIYFACRQIAFGQSTAGSARIDLSVLWSRLGDYHRAYAYHLFPPLGDLREMLRQHGPAISPWLALQMGLVLVAGAALAFAFREQRRGGGTTVPRGASLSFCMGWYVITTGLFVLTYFAPRHLYLASAGVCLAIVIALRRARSSTPAFWVGALAIIALYGSQLWPALQPWRDAAAISRDVSLQLVRTATEAAPGGAIIVNVPGNVATAVCWEWAIPFATEPPFLPQVAQKEIVVLGGPDTYAFPKRWPTQPAIANLAKIDQESWIIELTAAGEVRRRAVPVERLRKAASLLANVSPTSARAAWDKFIAELNLP
jgi:hypothetical protein